MDERNDNQGSGVPPRTPPEGVRIIGAEEAASALESGDASGRRPSEAPRFGDVPSQPSGPRPLHRFPVSGEQAENEAKRAPGATVVASDDDDEVFSPPNPTPPPGLPHWTEPPTGEVPKILGGDEAQVRTQGPAWRDDNSGWDEDEDAVPIASDDIRVGALDTDRPEMFSFDEETAATEPPVASRAAMGRAPLVPPRPYDHAGASRNMTERVGTGIAAAAVTLLAFAIGPAAVLVLTAAAAFLGAVEFYDVIRRAGYRPATLLGIVGSVGMVFAAYASGDAAIPLVLALATIFSFLWYLTGASTARPSINVAVTLLGVLWVGLLASFGGLLLRIPDDRGLAFFAGAIIATVAYDVTAYFVGKQMGTKALAPAVSPNKTVEGAMGGTAGAFVVCFLVVTMISPWGAGDALWLALVTSVLAPLGDVCQSMIKRDLGIKDMGSILPGHGGVLDRCDALLFMLPATYYLVHFLGIV